MAGLFKEIWLPKLKEDFYPKTSILSEPKDITVHVSNNKINLAEAGVKPAVLVNFDDYPVPTKQRKDNHHEISLDTFDTENTLIRDTEKAELAYEKYISVVRGHKQALLETMLHRAMQSYAPTSNSKYTPVLATTGSDDNGTKRITFDDILRLRVEFNQSDTPQEGRVLVLDAMHEFHLMMEDMKQYKAVFNGDNNFAGFTIYSLSSDHLPRYNNSDGSKVALGAAASNTDAICSIAFQKDEVYKCIGEAKMFDDVDSPAERGTTLGFQMRASHGTFRNRGVGAIYSASA